MEKEESQCLQRADETNNSFEDFLFSFLKLSNLDGLGRIWVEEEDER